MERYLRAKRKTHRISGTTIWISVMPDGDNVTLKWGISQFLPLKKDASLLLENPPGGVRHMGDHARRRKHRDTLSPNSRRRGLLADRTYSKFYRVT
jgi:hypothetical protein